jgi:hypothetical protein
VGDVVGRLLRSGAGQLEAVGNAGPGQHVVAPVAVGRTVPDALVEPLCPRLVARGLDGPAVVAGSGQLDRERNLVDQGERSARSSVDNCYRDQAVTNAKQAKM